METHRAAFTIVLIAAATAGATCHGSGSEPPKKAPTAGATSSTTDRLTREQYADSLADLFAVTVTQARVPKESIDAYGVRQPTPIAPNDVRAYLEDAEAAVKGAKILGALTPYDAGCAAQSRACAETMVRTLGRKLYRRALDDDEVTALLQVYDGSKESHSEKLGLVLDAMLVSPHFLYVGDFDTPDVSGTAVPIEQHALAARLSYFLWQSFPDDELLTAADEGRLATREDVVTEARRLVDHVEKSERAVRAFTRRWLDLDRTQRLVKSATFYGDFDSMVAPVLGQESELFVADVVLHGDARYETLLTSPTTFVNTSTARFYGKSDVPADGSSFTKVSLDPATRAGLLTQLPFLALTGHTVDYSPTLRGKVIRERFLCESMTSPPPDVDVSPPAHDETKTVRQQYQEHAANPYCAACHYRMDPIGVGFARYDSAGRYSPNYFESNPDTQSNPTNGSWLLDDSGQVFDSKDADGPFHGPIELSQRLAGSREAQDCFVRQVFRFALSRGESEHDAKVMAQLQNDFQASGHNIRDLLVSIAASDAFRLRPARASQ